ncbi:phage tail protein [Dyella sp. 20L07]|uniref:phage tail protein n=1 Tax=Dyella sp. 20L07 TaxID=3384240 RepID=UPI003D2B832B
MSTPYLGQIVLVSFGFAPKTFAQCNGALLSIQQNAALFSLLGTVYGGNGVTTFQLPDLRGRTPYGMGTAPSGANYALGQLGGTETVTLQSTQVPPHTHSANVSSQAGTARSPTEGIYGSTGATSFYAPPGGQQVPLNQATLTTAGANQPHSNIQPYTALNFCIALNGIFPSRG